MLVGKSVNWFLGKLSELFLYDRNIDHCWVKLLGLLCDTWQTPQLHCTYKKIMHLISSWQRGPYPLFHEETSNTPYFSFSIFFQSPRLSMSPPTPNPNVLSVSLFLWLNGWSHHIWCAILLNDIMDLLMSRYGTLVQEGPWCVFYVTRCQVNWGLTHVAFWHTKTHSTLRGQ